MLNKTPKYLTDMPRLAFFYTGNPSLGGYFNQLGKINNQYLTSPVCAALTQIILMSECSSTRNLTDDGTRRPHWPPAQNGAGCQERDVIKQLAQGYSDVARFLSPVQSYFNSKWEKKGPRPVMSMVTLTNTERGEKKTPSNQELLMRLGCKSLRCYCAPYVEGKHFLGSRTRKVCSLVSLLKEERMFTLSSLKNEWHQTQETRAQRTQHSQVLKSFRNWFYKLFYMKILWRKSPLLSFFFLFRYSEHRPNCFNFRIY